MCLRFASRSSRRRFRGELAALACLLAPEELGGGSIEEGGEGRICREFSQFCLSAVGEVGI